MKLSRTDLENYLNDLLAVDAINDYCPNGLQVEGKAEIKTIVTGVTACQALLDEAVALKADAVVVHHGYFWKGEDERVLGMKKCRLATLLRNDINLFAYHLPLDEHAEIGNNVQLARVMEWPVTGHFAPSHEVDFHGWRGELTKELSLQELAADIEKKLGRKPLTISAGDFSIKKIAWCTGGTQDFIAQAAACGADAYISGEVSERTTHLARELGIHYIAAGHHATERYGVKALGEHLAKQFGLAVQFVDVGNVV